MLLEKVYSGKPQGSVPSLDLFLGSITAQLGMRGDPQGCVCGGGGEVTAGRGHAALDRLDNCHGQQAHTLDVSFGHGEIWLEVSDMGLTEDLWWQ